MNEMKLHVILARVNQHPPVHRPMGNGGMPITTPRYGWISNWVNIDWFHLGNPLYK
jgi:hypothetical protein